MNQYEIEAATIAELRLIGAQLWADSYLKATDAHTESYARELADGAVHHFCQTTGLTPPTEENDDVSD